MRTFLAAAVATALLFPAAADAAIDARRSDAVRSIADYAPDLFRFEAKAAQATFAIVRATFGPTPLASSANAKLLYRHVKAFVCINACAGAARDLDAPSAALEFQPLADSSGAVSFRAFALLAAGEPVAHVNVIARTDAGIHALRTDAHGSLALSDDIVGEVSLTATAPGAGGEHIAVATFTLDANHVRRAVSAR